MKYNLKNNTIEESIKSKGITSVFKQSSEKQKRKLDLQDSNAKHKYLSPSERFLFEMQQNDDFESRMISKSLNSLPIRSRKLNNDTLNSSFVEVNDVFESTIDNDFTSNFCLQDIDRFGKSINSKKPVHTNPGPGSYYQERVIKQKGGYLPKTPRKFDFIKPKQGPGPWYYKSTIEPKHISFRLDSM